MEAGGDLTAFPPTSALRPPSFYAFLASFQQRPER